MLPVKNNKYDIVHLKVINGSEQLKIPKRKTVNNNKEDRWVDPIREKDDVKKCIKYLTDKITSAKKRDARISANRNLLLFIIGINIGVRVSDLCVLRWSDFIEKDMKTFKSVKNVKETKTGKTKLLCINDPIKNAIKNYLEFLNTEGILVNYNDFLFLNARNLDNRITDAAVEDMIKDLQKNLKLEGNYNTHSLRKTYAYHKYMMYYESGDPLAIAKVQKDLNHRNTIDTIRYLGIERQERIESSYALGGYWDE